MPIRGASRTHDREQWKKLQALPNLIYTDGNEFSVWHDGELHDGTSVVKLGGDVHTSGGALTAGADLLSAFSSFFTWAPTPPRNAPELARISARLCRLLRDETTEKLAIGDKFVVELRDDWRQVLAPGADDHQFADGYAQAVTFGLLMAKARDISLAKGVGAAARDLADSDTLIGTALEFLTHNPKTLDTSLRSLTRVLDVVHWPSVSRGRDDAWLYFYEYFLEIYDPQLRKLTGSYYTPPEVVGSMIRMTDNALRHPSRFGLPGGLRSPAVTIVDPAVGTGTFLLGILRHISEAVAADIGRGAVPGAVTAAKDRLIGFELQFGPFVVAQLRLIGELVDLTHSKSVVPRLFVTDTLSDPRESRARLPSLFAPLTDSYEEANRIKEQEPITVVIGNPPYKEKMAGHGGWVENGRSGESGPLDNWLTPPAWRAGAHLKHLKNLYVYFWRWATWKVFGDGAGEATRRDRKGIVCFITVAGFLNGPGFQKMRADLRRDADEIWVIDCSPEGHQPPVGSRIFQAVQQPVCIVIASRNTDAGTATPAVVRHRRLPIGARADKFAALDAMGLDDCGWARCPDQPRAPFLPSAQGLWGQSAPLEDLFLWDGSGVMPGRTWVIAPDLASLEARWTALRDTTDQIRQAALFHPHLRDGRPGDKHIDKPLRSGLSGHEFRPGAVRNDKGAAIAPTRYGMRTLDRQWIIPDARLINQPNPSLWQMASDRQVFLTALMRYSPSNGPALSFSAVVPDHDHYKGSFAGRAFPLWANADASASNVRPAVLARIGRDLGANVSAPDLLAYIAAVAAHPAYTGRFQSELVQPGLRIPLTARAAAFRRAVDIGREVIWLHTYGERYTDVAAGRPAGPPRVVGGGPTIPASGAISPDPARFPNSLLYDPAARRLFVGDGYVDNVPPAVRDYEVSGKNVIDQWFSYRRLDRSRPIIGDRRPPSPLDAIQPDGWPDIYTTDLVNLLHVLCRLVALEPAQAQLLDDICTGALIDADLLRADGVFDDASASAVRTTDDRQGEFEL